MQTIARQEDRSTSCGLQVNLEQSLEMDLTRPGRFATGLLWSHQGGFSTVQAPGSTLG